MFTSFKTKSQEKEVQEVVEALSPTVKKVVQQLKDLAKSISLSLEERDTQYASSDEVWRFYKG